jgi:hypothetical protein
MGNDIETNGGPSAEHSAKVLEFKPKKLPTKLVRVSPQPTADQVYASAIDALEHSARLAKSVETNIGTINATNQVIKESITTMGALSKAALEATGTLSEGLAAFSRSLLTTADRARQDNALIREQCTAIDAQIERLEDARRRNAPQQEIDAIIKEAESIRDIYKEKAHLYFGA